MIPFDYIEPLVVLSRLFAPGYAFFLINPKAKDPTADRLRKVKFFITFFFFLNKLIEIF